MTRQVGPGRLPVEGALVRIGRVGARTDAAGRATLRFRLGGEPGLRRVRVSLPGLEPARAHLRVLSAR